MRSKKYTGEPSGGSFVASQQGTPRRSLDKYEGAQRPSICQFELADQYKQTMTEYHSNTIFTHIAHLSDLHIGSKPDRYVEYDNVLDTFTDLVKGTSFKDSLLIVITGDLFHWKSRLAPEDIICFNRFMRNLNPLPVLIILGNHDTVVNNKNREDLISPLVSQHTNVMYSKNTELFKVGQLKFFHISVFDHRKEDELYTAMLEASKGNVDAAYFNRLNADGKRSTNRILEDKINRPEPVILLYHGFADGAKMGSHTVSGSDISRRIIELSKMTLLGDIHESQFITPNCAYAGSLIQQNVGEDTNKGFILWSTEKYAGRFINVPNKRIMVRVDYREGQEGIRIYNRMTEGMSDDEKKLLLKNITRVTLITESYGAVLKQQVDEVRHTFGRMDNISPVDKGVGSRPDTLFLGGNEGIPTTINGLNSPSNRENVINAVMAASAQLSPLETQIATIKQLIKDKADKLIPLYSALPAEAREEKITKITNGIVSLHRGYITDSPIRKWTIKSMRWDNVLIYGKGNFIDFEAISSGNAGVITGCIAPNRSGKSSIFDILVYALFGEHLRGDKKSVFHRGATTMAVRVDFEVNDVKYYIERVDRSNNKSSVIRLASLKNGVEELITGESIPDTYNKMRQLIGTLDEFLATGLFYDNENDIVRLGRAARRETLSRLFGLVDNDKVIKEEKKKLKELNTSLYEIETKLKNKLVGGSGVNVTEENFESSLSVIDEKLKSNRLQLETADKRQIELKVESAKIESDWHSVSAEIKDIKDSIASITDLNRMLKMQTEVVEKKEARLSALKKEITQRVVELPVGITARSVPLNEQSKTKYQNIITSPFNNTASNETAKINMSDVGKMIVDWTQQIPVVENDIKESLKRIQTVLGKSDIDVSRSGILLDANIEIENATKTLNTCQSQLEKDNAAATIAINATNELLASMGGENMKYDTLSTKEVVSWNNELLNSIISSERIIRGINIDLKMSETNSAERVYKAAESKTHYKFNNDCADCKSNIGMLSMELSKAKDEYERRKTLLDIAVGEHKNEEEKLSKLESKRKNMEKIISSMKAADDAKSKVKDITTTIVAITDKIEKFKMCSNDITKKAELENNLRQLKDKIAAGTHLHNDYLRAQFILTREEIDLAAEIPVLKSSITSAQEKIMKYENKGRSLNAKEEELAAISVKRTNARNSITQYNELSGQLKLIIDDLEEFIEIKREYDTTTPQLHADIELHTIYTSLLGAKGLQTQVIKRNINSVVNRINAILSAITTFRIAIDVSDTKIDLFISDSVAGDLTKDIPIELASGFQKFVISLIFRLSLTHSLFTSSKFVICDESFSTFDQNNIMHVPELLNAVKSYYDFIFIISHIEVLQNCVEVPIHIDVEEKLEVVDRAMAKKIKEVGVVGGTKADAISSSVLSIITSHVIAPVGAEPTQYKIPVDITEKVLNADKIKAKKEAADAIKTTVQCECGAIVQKRSLTSHKKSAKHLVSVQQISIVQ